MAQAPQFTEQSGTPFLPLVSSASALSQGEPSVGVCEALLPSTALTHIAAQVPSSSFPDEMKESAEGKSLPLFPWPWPPAEGELPIESILQQEGNHIFHYLQEGLKIAKETGQEFHFLYGALMILYKAQSIFPKKAEAARILLERIEVYRKWYDEASTDQFLTKKVYSAVGHKLCHLAKKLLEEEDCLEASFLQNKAFPFSFLFAIYCTSFVEMSLGEHNPLFLRQGAGFFQLLKDVEAFPVAEPTAQELYELIPSRELYILLVKYGFRALKEMQERYGLGALPQYSLFPSVHGLLLLGHVRVQKRALPVMDVASLQQAWGGSEEAAAELERGWIQQAFECMEGLGEARDELVLPERMDCRWAVLLAVDAGDCDWSVEAVLEVLEVLKFYDCPEDFYPILKKVVEEDYSEPKAFFLDRAQDFISEATRASLLAEGISIALVFFLVVGVKLEKWNEAFIQAVLEDLLDQCPSGLKPEQVLAQGLDEQKTMEAILLELGISQEKAMVFREEAFHSVVSLVGIWWWADWVKGFFS